MTRARRDRGNVSILVALLLPILIGFAALALDFGHAWQVRSELHNATDAAALAGVRDLNGTVAGFAPARASAQRYARAHLANLTSVDVDLNSGNDPNGDIVLGHWDFDARTFTAADAVMPVPRVNAIKVTAHRTAATGNPIQTYFMSFFGHDTLGVGAHAIAAGGTPNAIGCAWPLVVSDCSLYDASGNLRCNAVMTFQRAPTDNVGFTMLQPRPPVDTPGIECEIEQALGAACKPQGTCTCSSSCPGSAIQGGEIYISNGNNLSDQMVNDINAAVQRAGGGGLFADLPVLDSGGLSYQECGSFQFNRSQRIAGYVHVQITGATPQPNRSIRVRVDCTRDSTQTAGGQGFYGLDSTQPYLVE
jgi:Flp pilus assembly protein TadG